MSEPFVGQISMFAGNFAPRDWAFCQGQLLSVAENPDLATLLGNRYGGDGRITFALPDLSGRVPIHHGKGPGLTNRDIGDKGGTEFERIDLVNMPNHNHKMNASSTEGTEDKPIGKYIAKSKGFMIYDNHGVPDEYKVMNDGTLGYTGKSREHYNIAPSLCINFIISLKGKMPECD